CDAELDGAIDRALEDGDGSRASLAEAGGLVADLALRVPLVRPSYLLSTDSLETGTVVAPGSAEGTDADVCDNAPPWRRPEGPRRERHPTAPASGRCSSTRTPMTRPSPPEGRSPR